MTSGITDQQRLSSHDPVDVLNLVRQATPGSTEPDELLVRRVVRSLPPAYRHDAPAGDDDTEPSAEPSVGDVGVSLEELIEFWTLLDNEVDLAVSKRHRRLGFALQLKHYSRHGHFPASASDIPSEVVDFVARQLDVDHHDLDDYPWAGRTVERHHSDIRAHLDYRVATVDDQDQLTEWLVENVTNAEQRPEHVRRCLLAELRHRRIEAPTSGRIARIVNSAIRTAERSWTDRIAERLSAATTERLTRLLDEPEADSILALIRSDAGNLSLTSIHSEIYKLHAARSVELPPDLFDGTTPSLLDSWVRRASIESPSHLRRHRPALTLTLLAALVHRREQQIIDALVELLIATVHRIGARAERRVVKELIAEFKAVTGKENILFSIAGAALERPDESVRDVVYPAVTGGEDTLRDLVAEFRSKGSTYRRTVQSKLRASYTSHYRSGLIAILDVLEFRSNNSRHQPIIDALALVAQHAHTASNRTYYPLHETVPEHQGITRDWAGLVHRTDSRGRQRIVRNVYEIVTFQALREQLRCKAIWVVGADSFRNPDDDLPADFAQHRTENYRELRKPLDPTEFIDDLRNEMHHELAQLDHDLPNLDWLDISDRKTGAIKLTKYEAAPEPVNLRRIKNEVQRRWGTVALIDILKETVLRTNCFAGIHSIDGTGALDPAVLAERLLLTIYAYGTNTGIRAVAAGAGHSHHEDDLRYIRRRYLNPDTAQAIAINIANATFQARNHDLWGAGSTSVASDSTHFRTYDQNLLTEWHSRYGGRGILIYWHVERGSMVVHSQTLRASASEVHAMVEGAIRHGTDMRIEGNYVDTHGQSQIGFGITRLLGFDLLPRIKQINRIKLYRPSAASTDAYPHLTPALTRPIRWEIIEQNYDEMIKYATAIRQRTATTEAILRRFTRTASHPTYQAMLEVGRAQRTIFVARYLRRRDLQREITEGLNVVESFNRANSVIHYGKGGEIASNSRDEHELSALCLRILQAALVYINTLMLQDVLSEQHWLDLTTPTDRRALTPLFWQHILPYGEVQLDMTHRLQLGA